MGQTAPNTETDRYSLSLIYVFLVPRAHATGEHVSEAKTRAEARRRGDREERESVRGGDEREARSHAEAEGDDASHRGAQQIQHRVQNIWARDLNPPLQYV